MMCDFVYTIPNGVPISEDIKERSLAYMVVLLFGHRYYVPITKHVKKVLGLKIRDGKIVYPGFDKENAIENMFRDVIQMVMMQVRHDLASQVEDSIMQEVREGFDKLMRPQLEKILEQKIIIPALPEGKKK